MAKEAKGKCWYVVYEFRGHAGEIRTDPITSEREAHDIADAYRQTYGRTLVYCRVEEG